MRVTDGYRLQMIFRTASGGAGKGREHGHWQPRCARGQSADSQPQWTEAGREIREVREVVRLIRQPAQAHGEITSLVWLWWVPG